MQKGTVLRMRPARRSVYGSFPAGIREEANKFRLTMNAGLFKHALEVNPQRAERDGEACCGGRATVAFADFEGDVRFCTCQSKLVPQIGPALLFFPLRVADYENGRRPKESQPCDMVLPVRRPEWCDQNA